jgi:hypothetical protein
MKKSLLGRKDLPQAVATKFVLSHICQENLRKIEARDTMKNRLAAHSYKARLAFLALTHHVKQVYIGVLGARLLLSRISPELFEKTFMR